MKMRFSWHGKKKKKKREKNQDSGERTKGGRGAEREIGDGDGRTEGAFKRPPPLRSGLGPAELGGQAQEGTEARRGRGREPD